MMWGLTPTLNILKILGFGVSTSGHLLNETAAFRSSTFLILRIETFTFGMFMCEVFVQIEYQTNIYDVIHNEV